MTSYSFFQWFLFGFILFIVFLFVWLFIVGAAKLEKQQQELDKKLTTVDDL